MKKFALYTSAFAVLCVMFTSFYYFSYKSALKKFNEQAVKQNSEAFSGAGKETSPKPDGADALARLEGESENGTAGAETQNHTEEYMNAGVSDETDGKDAVAADALKKDKIMPYTAYVIETYNVATDTYTTETLRPPADLVGLTREEVEAYFAEYVQDMPLSEYEQGLASVELTEFSRKELTVRKIYNSALVPYQYYLVVRDGYVVVYYSDKKTVFEYTHIKAEDLPIEDQAKLSEGIGVEDAGILYGILEGYSS